MIEKALRYQTEGDDWVKRIAIGGGLLLFSIFLIPVFTVYGYLLEVVRNALRGDVEQPPKWGDYDLVDLTINGLKAFVILFAYSFVVSIISWVPSTLLGAIGGALDIGLFALLGTLVYLTLSLVGGLAVAVITPVALSNFVLKEEISAGFDINVMKNIIPEIAMLRAVGISIVIYLITAIASGVVSILVITALIVPFILFVGISGIALVWGQGFAEAYDLTYTDEDEEESAAHTTSWGLSWRAIGALIMTHSDDQGLVLPPALAPTQVVVVPIWQADTEAAVREYAADLAAELDEEFRVELDDRDGRNPGFKFNEHELNGVPLRIEIGPDEVEDGEATLVHRPDGESEVADRGTIVGGVDDALESVYAKLYAAAEENLADNVREAHGRDEILGTLGRHGGYVKTGWCGDEACDDEIKDEIAAEIVMLPLDEDEDPVHDTCGVCGDDAVETAYFAKSY